MNNVSLTAGSGSITGMLGPNGAGKTTTFNACTGVVPAWAGTLHLGDCRLNGRSTASRAAHGLGRTFQRMELFDSMTVRENVALGPEAAMSARRPWGQLFCPAKEAREIRSRTSTAIDLCGLGALANRTSGDLSTGQRRLVELARAIASPFRFLLLDEPSSGLDVQETEQFGAILRTFVAETGIGVLLVEHDMALVADVCTYIHVLDFGCKIFEGTTAETMSSDIVRAAYLGSEGVSAAAEGLAHA
ncbi:ABC transporter ATP-binding protein [Sporichthya sp.]|uniref:ABC transporter ATP-binding protein n=1 Tax=Sporichthya sp. TaxID=65475 RepID=UPI0025E9D876|nr:ATP-binding cassette domain-containing protein [Sporichthya sp.]